MGRNKKTGEKSPAFQRTIIMNKYLEKIAAKKEELKDNNTYGKAWRTSIGVGLGTTVAGQALGGYHSYKLLNSINLDKSESGSNKETIKKMVHDNKLNVTFDEEVDRHVNKAKRQLYSPKEINKVNDAAFIPGEHMGYHKNFIRGGDTGNADVVLHELGHATDFSRFGKAKTYVGMIGRTLAGSPLGHVATLSAAAAVANNDDPNKAKWAPVIPAVPAASIMREEFMANYHAAKGIAKHKGAGAARKFWKTTGLRNQINYLAATGAPVAAAAIAAHIIQKRKEQHRRLKKVLGN